MEHRKHKMFKLGLIFSFSIWCQQQVSNSLDGANKGLEEKVVLKMVMTLKLTHMGKKKSYERDPETLSPQGQRSFKMEWDKVEMKMTMKFENCWAGYSPPWDKNGTAYSSPIPLPNIQQQLSSVLICLQIIVETRGDARQW